MIRKAVIPAAGLGIRLLSATKEQPKEMLPLFARSADGQIRVRPLLQIVFEQLYDAGLREFCFVVGRGKRIVEDFFTPDKAFVEQLQNRKRPDLAQELDRLYKKIESSVIMFVNQPQPRGFGDAIYSVRAFTGGDPFIVHAGDDLIISKNNNHLMRLMDAFKKYETEVAFFVEKVKDPTKYGVIEGAEVDPKVYKVGNIVEKPIVPPSNMAIVAIYIFTSSIFQALKTTKPDKDGEIQLTDAIQQLVQKKHRVYAVELNQDQRRIDIGTPESYWQALTAMYKSNSF
jgi:UTP--glucose-1-phosphate uridylyltransferase